MTTTSPAAPPADPVAAAAWLAGRHPIVQQIVARIVGPDWADVHWAQALANTINEEPALNAAWDDYGRTHPEPARTGDLDASERAWEAWAQAGPRGSAQWRAYAPMSSTEKRLVRLLATLADRVPWTVEDVWAVGEWDGLVEDWTAVVLRIAH